MPRLNNPGIAKNVNTKYRVWCEIVPTENDCSIVYGFTTTFLKKIIHTHEFLINLHECDTNITFKTKYAHLYMIFEN